MESQAQRQQFILQHAAAVKSVNATQLSQALGVAVQTVRRDLRQLCEDGSLERVHGGAVLPSGVANIGYDARRTLNRHLKKRIAQRVAKLIPDNASLFMNIGTTTEAVAAALSTHRNLMVVTNNINIANIMAAHASCDVVVAGGKLRRADGGLTGDLAALAIQRFKVDFAVIGASAIDANGDLLDFDPEEVRVSQQILAAARSTIVVGDSSKFSRKAPVRIASLADADHFVTDAIASERFAISCQDWNTKIHLA